LEHLALDQVKKVLTECKRVGKTLLITLPNADKPNYDRSLVENPEHKWLPTNELVAKLVEASSVEHTEEDDFILLRVT